MLFVRFLLDPYASRSYPAYDRYDRIPHKVKLNFKRLRMWWVEYENGVEYRLKYNDTKPGLWISSGPQNGNSVILKIRRIFQ